MANLHEEYHALGVEHFVLCGYPHLKEAYWPGEGLIPEPATRGLLAETAAEGGAPPLVAGGP